MRWFDDPRWTVPFQEPPSQLAAETQAWLDGDSRQGVDGVLCLLLAATCTITALAGVGAWTILRAVWP